MRRALDSFRHIVIVLGDMLQYGNLDCSVVQSTSRFKQVDILPHSGLIGAGKTKTKVTLCDAIFLLICPKSFQLHQQFLPGT